MLWNLDLCFAHRFHKNYISGRFQWWSFTLCNTDSLTFTARTIDSDNYTGDAEKTVQHGNKKHYFPWTGRLQTHSKRLIVRVPSQHRNCLSFVPKIRIFIYANKATLCSYLIGWRRLFTLVCTILVEIAHQFHWKNPDGNFQRHIQGHWGDGK